MIGHSLRHDSLTKSVIEGDVEGYIGRGKLRMKYIKKNCGGHGMNSYKKSSYKGKRGKLQQTNKTIEKEIIKNSLKFTIFL